VSSLRQCKFCGYLITFVRLAHGRWQAQNLDNTLHKCANDKNGTPVWPSAKDS
jgi:hypothetical protein